MADTEHKEPWAKRLICLRGYCSCQDKNYRDICKDEAAGWASYSYTELKGGSVTRYEAHHIVCRSPVADILGDEKVVDLVAATDWCVNNKKNMKALPLWGHTVKYYCFRDGPPKWENLPQHDFGHNNSKGCYTEEVEEKLKNLVKKLKKKKRDHKLEGAQDIKAKLNSLSDSFRQILDGRGKRLGGTHEVWTNKSEWKNWAQPFFMAKKAGEYGFPTWAKKRREKMRQIEELQKHL